MSDSDSISSTRYPHNHSTADDTYQLQRYLKEVAGEESSVFGRLVAYSLRDDKEEDKKNNLVKDNLQLLKNFERRFSKCPIICPY